MERPNTADPSALRSLERAVRWISRIDQLTRQPKQRSMPAGDPTRLAIEDYAAAALAELAEVFAKARDQVTRAYRQVGHEERDARELARKYTSGWLKDYPYLRGLLALRHLDVHVVSERAGHRLRGGPQDRESWVLTRLSASANAMLWPANRLSDVELERFHEDLREMDAVRALGNGVSMVRVFLRDLDVALGRIPDSGERRPPALP